jgi:putative SOS response-associated peptidase YedK
MCGRYSLTRREAELVERFGIEQLICESEKLAPRFNIAPSQLVPVIINKEGHRVLCQFKWGLIPFWAKDLKKNKPVINARSESVAEKPFFKQALLKRRCLIPADGFYEWKHQNKNKIPMYIHVNDRELFAFAGLWDEWTSPDGEVIRTCTIITTEANNSVAPVHDRMPVIVRAEHEALWLDPDIREVTQLTPVLAALPDEAIKMYQVSPRVNSPSQDLPELVEPVPTQSSVWEAQK